MLAKTAKSLLTRFLEFTESEVLGAFATLANAQKHEDFVYVPGARKDRVLLVAHADTVNDKMYSPKLHWMGDVCTLESFWRSKSKHVYTPGPGVYSGRHSLGADDRAGCTMLWALQTSGHSLLITTGEEKGCKGAAVAARTLKEELPRHAYALEVDRRGDRQAVFYDVSTQEFEEHMLDLLNRSDPEEVEWLQELGSMTDIRTLCPSAGICGVNLSAGYHDEHSSSEHLYLEAWLHTHGTLLRALKEEQKRFVLPPPKKAVVTTHYSSEWQWCYVHNCYSKYCPVSMNENCARIKEEDAKSTEHPTNGGKAGQTESPFRLQPYRTGGTKAGEGTVTLRGVGADGKPVTPLRISKRQCKKFGKFLLGLLAKGAVNNAEATSLLGQAIALRDGTRQTVSKEQREAHAAGDTSAFVIIRDAQGKVLNPKPPEPSMLGQAGVFAKYEFTPELGRCWHHCRGCNKIWYHERREESEDRPNFFCYCPVCSPEVVPRLITAGEYAAAIWGYAQKDWPAPQIAVDAAYGIAGTPAKENATSLRDPVLCQHYCTRCSAPWKHLRQPVTRGGGILCKVGAYDKDCPVHSADSAKAVIAYEEALNLKQGGWRQTLHAPPPEQPATGNGSHGAAPVVDKAQLPIAGMGTSQG